ncbi:MAG TPA: PadR family transcriptional regulator [Candidatus Polarisedimenticolia bacterium]|nr:PadR family transcriptional regulator [Candidatus Polarisedimenticolia bacterium]
MTKTSPRSDRGSRSELVRGSLEILILKALATGPLHGLGIARRVEQLTGGAFEVKAGSLFPALHRLEEGGWLDAEWGESETRRKARFYRLTAEGQKRLRRETGAWRRVALALAQALSAPARG